MAKSDDKKPQERAPNEHTEELENFKRLGEELGRRYKPLKKPLPF